MKLIGPLQTKNLKAALLIILPALFMNISIASPSNTWRVFWNKFDVTASTDNKVILTWNVTEYNNKSFVVQHSTNGTDWKDIRVVQSKNSAESVTEYSYIHNNKLRGKQFYRIRDIDVDIQSGGVSPIKTLMLQEEKPAAAIWPNPATSHITIAKNDDKIYTKVRIIDLTGKVMSENKLEAHSNNISVSELPGGTYIIKVENNKGDSYSQKIVKQ